MHRLRAAGVGLSIASVAAYAGGIVAAYPGRELSLPGLMVGITLLSIGGPGEPGPADGPETDDTSDTAEGFP